MSELRTIELPGSSAKTSRVGFGCSNLLGDKTREAGVGLLNQAYESGVRHFDVARVYNYGDAEALVGEFAAGKRDSVTICTKFGFMPREGVAKMKGPVQLVRRLMRSSSWVRKLVRRNVRSLTQAGQFDPVTARVSLETSLRMLRTEYIDIYLLHEGSVGDCSEEIFAFLEQAKAEGKIRAFGCGSAFEKVPPIASSRPKFLQVAQFESSIVRPNVEDFYKIRPLQNLLPITHGAMAATSIIKNHVASYPILERKLMKITGLEIAKGSTLYGLVLCQALHENPDGMVLFRASTKEKIQATLKAMDNINLTDEQFADIRGIANSIAV
jgi:aryl-alcohol dehydrogenase-like predicted oxidoreductase